MMLRSACAVLVLASSVDAFWKKKDAPKPVEETKALEYGADISFPMTREKVSTNYPWLPHNVDSSIETPEEYKDMPIQPLGDKQTFYENYIKGCVEQYAEKGERCLNNERDRFAMTLRQPKSMKNYTEHGFAKIRAPESLMELLYKFWNANSENQKSENWPAGNTYVNHWGDGDSYMVSVEDSNLEHGGFMLKQMIWNAARDTLQEWTGQQMAECSLYGIRVYKEGAVLAPHVDRLPLVSSAIINVAQDVDEPWPLEVIGHDGKAHNVTMLPGDLVLYESHSIIHGRPFPLKGRFMANVFIHFEPIGPMGGETEFGGDLPPYLIPGSEEEEHWRRANPNGHKLLKQRKFDTGSTDAHIHAREGKLEELKAAVKYLPEVINASDNNGWQPLHEAVRSGDTEIVKFLLENGADPNSRTEKKGNGASALHWAREYHDEDHPVVVLLKNNGAKDYARGQKVETEL